jgi:hypothetical protein
MDRKRRSIRNATVFLQAVVVLVGTGAFILLLWEPHLEGKNVHATTFEIYFKDPFLAYAYFASVAFFVALFQAFTLLGHIGRNCVFSLESVRAIRIIKYCALILAAMIGLAVAYLFVAVRGKDDIAGGVAMGVVMIFASSVIATAAAIFEKLLQNAVEIKTENDLVV